MSNKRYLLISPPTPQTITQTSNKSVDNLAMFPVGLAYISAVMKRGGFDVYTLNGSFVEGDFDSYLQKIITTNGIDVICVGGQSIDVHGILKVIEVARRVNPRVIIVCGGAIVSADPHTAMQVLKADVGVIGEGEEAMCELAHTLNTGSPLHAVPGIIHWERGKLQKTQERPEVQNLDELPMMDFDGFSYRRWLECNDNAGIIFTARSCPFKCTFCFKSTGERYRSRSLDSIFTEINFQIASYGITALNLSDELFAAKKQRVIDFCERIRPYNLRWGCSLRIPEIVKGLLPMMKASGCTGIGTGLESASPEILLSMKKRITVEQIEKAFDAFNSSGLVMLGNLIFGDINETKETYKESINFWHRHKDNVYINLGTINALPGTYLYNYACSEGLITNKEQYLKEGKFICNVSKLNEEEYYEMLSEITELSFLPQVPAKTVLLRSVNLDGICTMDWTCRRCDELHTSHNIHFLQAEICLCSCGIQNTVEPFRVVTPDSEALTVNLRPKIEYGFWGVGSQYCRIARCFGNDMLQDSFIQIDTNKHHQKMRRLGKKIYSPDIINVRKIENIIITSPTARNEIISMIRSDFPSVSNIYFPSLKSREGEFFCSFERI